MNDSTRVSKTISLHATSIDGLQEIANRYFQEKYLALKKDLTRMQQDFDEGNAVSYGELIKIRKTIVEIDDSIVVEDVNKLKTILLNLAESDREWAAKNYHSESQTLLDNPPNADYEAYKKLIKEGEVLVTKATDEKLKNYLQSTTSTLKKLIGGTDHGRIELRRDAFQDKWAKLDEVVVALGGKSQK